MIRNGRSSIESRATDSGRKRKSLLLGAFTSGVALALGAFNIAVASVEPAGVDASPAALESRIGGQAAGAASNVAAPSGKTGGVDASARALGSRVPAQAVAAADDAARTTGQVVVFETETRGMTAFDDPRACNNAPDFAHTIMNFTNEDITLFADDRCGVELIDVRPGFGSHVAPGQSFAAVD